MSEELSLYDRLGGEAAVNAAVDLFYGKVLDDYRINRFFDGLDMSKQAAHLKAFMAVAFGGPINTLAVLCVMDMRNWLKKA